MISKKDLLKEMNISYGQLYRWKREGLIPDDWFEKQSVSTGQETFFKRTLIIPRIKQILSLKDNYELQEIKNMFNDNNKKHSFSAREVILIDEIDPYILKSYLIDRKELTITELAIIYIFSKYQNLIKLEDYLNIDFKDMKLNDKNLYICSVADNNFLVIANKECIVDPKIKVLHVEKMEDVISYIALKVKEV